MDLTDKRVLVTGASRGIGFEIAKNFLDAGARIASTDEIAHAVMYLASDHARFITGTSLVIDGGTTAGKQEI